MDTFTRAYIDCALCNQSEHDDVSLESAGYSVDDIAPETLAQITGDCQAFQRDHAADIATRHNGESAAGHDFWLTRNHHGAGFWDGDWPKDVGKRLTDAAHVYGSVDLYIGDDGKIYG